MAAGVLKLVNSAFFGLRDHVSSPARAVNLLGLEVVKALVLGIGLFGRPSGEMKCAGAPLKYTFISDDHLRRRGIETMFQVITKNPKHPNVSDWVDRITAIAEEVAAANNPPAAEGEAASGAETSAAPAE
jgi:hypothetical protein